MNTSILLLCSIAIAVADSIPSVALSDINSVNDNVLQTDGIIAITDVPGLHESKKWVFSTMARCVYDSAEADASYGKYIKSFTMGDGSERFTIPGMSDGLQQHDMIIPDELLLSFKSCAELKVAIESLRMIFDQVTDSFITHFLGFHEKNGVSTKSKVRGNTPIVQAVKDGKKLDHLHAYRLGDKVVQNVEALPLHADHGYFVSFTPAEMFNGDGTRLLQRDAGFYWEDANGKVKRAEFPSLDCIVFMLGDEIINLSEKLRPVPHYLVLPDAVGDVHDFVARLWFGRMFLPEELAGSPIVDMQDESLMKTGSAGCNSVHRRVLADTPDSCKEGTSYCWMKCRDEPTCGDGEVPRCLNRDGLLYKPEDEHCTDCKFYCKDENISFENGGTEFCNGFVTDMYMDGFSFYAKDPTQPCLVWLFTGLKMDSSSLFALGCVAAFAAGLFTEYLVLFRRNLNGKTKDKPVTVGLRLKKGLFYMVAVTLGYFDMLLAMTYSVAIFSCVILGLSLGHILFNVTGPVAESTDPCCIGETEADSSDKNAIHVQHSKSSSSANSVVDKMNDEPKHHCHA